MGICRFINSGVCQQIQSSRSIVRPIGWMATVRHPEDVMFYADLQIQNMVVGSRYRVAIAASNAELAIGEATQTDFTLAGLPVLENPMLVRIDVRKASSTPRYQAFSAFGYMTRLGSSIYISQVREIV